MTEIRPVRRRPPSRRRRRYWRWVVGGVVVVAVFAAGVALGQALEDNPSPGGSLTVQRSLKPLPLAPARETVTVTVTSGG